MSALTTRVDPNVFLKPNFDAQAFVAELLAEASRSAEPTLDTASHPIGQPTSSGLLQASATSEDADRVPLSSTATQQHLVVPATLDGSSSKQATFTLGQDEGNLSLAISRLNLAIDEIESSINTQVQAHASDLLKRMAGVSTMEQRLHDLRSGMALLDKEVDGLKAKVHHPFLKLQQSQRELIRMEAASDLVAKVSRFLTVARRLEAQMDVLFSGGSHRASSGASEKGSAPALKPKPAAEEDDDAQDAIIGQVRGRELARAALILNEIASLLKAEEVDKEKQPNGEVSEDREQAIQEKLTDRKDEDVLPLVPSLLELDIVKQYLPSVDAARQTVTDYMEDMVVRGLRDLSPIMLSSSLQTAYNLGTLPDLVRDLLADLTDVVRERTRAAFDMASLGRELGLKEPVTASATYASYRGRRAGASNASGAGQDAAYAQWSSALFRRLETLIVSEMGAVCSKVYTLEKVLRLKTDAETGVNFLDEALQVLGDKPSLTFWMTFAQSFEAQSKEAVRRWPFVREMLSASNTGSEGTVDGYAALLRLFQQFFAKVSVYTDIVYTSSQQSPETVIVLRALSHLESA